tara:strand:+ start:6211 stop:7365 length:1155 start_codon:yes stop_codon:yes gene_type:complete
MAKRKAKTVYFTPEPNWAKMVGITDQETMGKAYQDVQYFVRTEIKDKEKIALTKAWIKNKSNWDSADVELILKCPDYSFGATSSVFYTFDKVGFMPDNIISHVEKRKAEWIETGKNVTEENIAKADAKPKKVISIQDRMKDQVSELCGEMEHFLDQLVEGVKTIKEFDPYTMMVSYQPEVKGAHAKIIKDDFATCYQESLEVLEWKDEDLKEAYSNFTPKMRKAYVEYHELINTACDTIIKTKATTRKARKPKARSKDKIVAKLKYKINDPELGLASITPTEIVYSNECWTYNTKTRKVGVYKASQPDPKNLAREGSGLTIKGTTIQGYCEDTSVQKTLRKPKEQIKLFAGAKTSCNKNFNEIKTTDTKMNGRFNEHMIILKSF